MPLHLPHRRSVLVNSFFVEEAVSGAECTFVDAAVSGASASTYDFTSIDLGAAAADRYILVGVVARNTGDATITEASCSIAGVTPTELLDTVSSGSGVGFLIAAVPTGTSGTISIVYSASRLRCAIAVWRITGLNSTTPTDGPDTDHTDAHSATLNVEAGGFVAGIVFQAGSATDCTWTNLTRDALFLEADWESNGCMSAGSENFAAAQSGLVVTADWTNPGGSGAGAFLAMR